MRRTLAMIAAAFTVSGPLAVSAQGVAGKTAADAAPLVTPSSPAAGAPPTDIVLIPRDTIVVVATKQGYNSYSALAGEKIRYEVAQDVIVNGHVVAKAGDTAYGAVQGAQAGRQGGYYGIGYKAANLRVSVDEVYNFCGDTIHVDFDRSEYRRRQGLFGSKADVEVIKGQEYAAATDRVQKVCGETTAEAPLPVPSDALRTADR